MKRPVIARVYEFLQTYPDQHFETWEIAQSLGYGICDISGRLGTLYKKGLVERVPIRYYEHRFIYSLKKETT